MAIYIGTDHVVTVLGLFDTVSQTFVDDATVVGALLTSGGGNVASFNLTYVTDSNGDYRGAIASSVTGGLSVDTDYIVQVTATSQGGIVLVDRDIHRAMYL